MEDKRKDAGNPQPATPVKDSPAAEAPARSSRRGGNNKRKASALGSGSTSAPTSTSSKRQAREKLPAVPFPPIHNGPLTRARQQPNNSATSLMATSPSGAKVEGGMLPPRGLVSVESVMGEEGSTGWSKEDWEALDSKIEANYEAIRSRNANVHIVPNHAGWFSWSKVHPLEEKTLPSFFSGKYDTRTPEIYMEMRNWIMKKFHSNPSTNIELKDLSEISVGELEARQEVMEFLNYWGLINYHPFPKADPPAVIGGDADKAAKTRSVVESLFRFESGQSFMPFVPRNSLATQAAPSGLFPESTFAEELLKSEGPSVDYHCNSCSADCSRKRYHCQKQADFDLCTECFNNGKFGSDMASSDFILMEPAEAGGASSRKWTDQETLLLLEALELFKENWNEIAEHVATKSKAQCILHFVQMPIEDMFLDDGNEINTSPKENVEKVSTNDTIIQDAIEMTEVKDNEDGNQMPSSPPKDDADNNQMPSSPPKSLKLEEVNKSTAGTCEEFVTKALTEAFEAVGSFPLPSEHFSFAEADNPVMTLAAFLVRLVKRNLATVSACSSLKIISDNASGDELASRHCFVLEDPPDEKRTAHSERTAEEITEEESPKDDEQNTEKQESSKLFGGGICASNDEENKSKKCTVMEEEGAGASPAATSIDKQASEKELNETSTRELLIPSPESESDTAVLLKENTSRTTVGPNNITMEVEVPPGFEKGTEDGTPLEESSEPAEAPKGTDSIPNVENKDSVQTTASNAIPEKGVDKDTGAEDCTNRKQGEFKSTIEIERDKIKNAAVTVLSAAAVKAKLLASQEEEQIHRLAALLVEKQFQQEWTEVELHKLEIKLDFCNEMENLVMRVREQLERSKQRLFHERAQIIAARLGMSSSRPMQPTLPANRGAMIFAHSVPRPIVGMSSSRPAVSRTTMMSSSTLSSFVPGSVVGSSSNQN